MKNKHKKSLFWLFGILALAIPILSSIIFGPVLDLPQRWDSWNTVVDGKTIKPDWTYILLIIFKLSLYVFPPMVAASGASIVNKKAISKKKYWYYLLTCFNYWFLSLLVIKLFADTILELDRIWNVTVFSSIKDIQTLIGFIVSILLKKQIKIEPAVGKNIDL